LSFPISAMRSAWAFNRSFESGEDVFLHFSAIEATGYCTLVKGSRVSFVVKMVSHGASNRTSHPGVGRERSTGSQLHGDRARFKQAMPRRLNGRELRLKLANLQLQSSAATKPKTGNKG
jgi:cold shock CspA family protein